MKEAFTTTFKKVLLMCFQQETVHWLDTISDGVVAESKTSEKKKTWNNVKQI